MTQIRATTVFVAVATVGGLVLGVGGTSTATLTSTKETAGTTSSCATVSRPFNPRTITLKGITRRAKVVTPPRTAGRVPGVPPLTEAGKEMFAWDQQSGIQPGDKAGTVRMNAHVWPDGSAVGNRMLRELTVGDRIVVFGKEKKLCYRVTKKVVVDASKTLPRYYSKIRQPQLGIVVCSGRRLGPGVWTKRTVWFAVPRV